VPVHKPKATWVRPEIQVEVKYTGLTDDGLLREAVFKGLRDDLALPQVKAPAIAPAGRSSEKPKIGVPRENILQLLPDAVVPAKEVLEAYWRKIGKRALKYLARRPLKLVRHTHGTTFYHKGRLPPIPDSVHQFRIAKREGGQGIRLWVDDVEGFLGLVSIGAVELHAWNATVDDIEHADMLVFDLDPGSGIEWSFVTETALLLRDLLKGEGFKSWPKVTGCKGVHVMVPVEPEFTHDEAHRYCREIAQRIAATDPERYTVSAALAHRSGRLFIDYLRNGRGTTAVATYSPRVRQGFPIAAPVTWKEIEHGIAPDAFTVRHLPPRR
jgi:bifunctional non-homologous end joining protein LigD